MTDSALRVLAHPASDPLRLPIEAWSLGAVAVILVIAAAALTGRSEGEREPSGAFELTGAARWALRIVSTGILLGAIVIARTGSPFELENPAPVLVLAFIWPLLPVLSLLVPSLWDRVDPFDTLARIFDPAGEEDDRPADVRIAALFALGWTWYLSVYVDPLDPGTFGLVLGSYTIAMLAGCLAAGRRSWLTRAESVGALCRTVANSVRIRPAALPRGGGLLLSVVTGGLLFGVLRLTPAWGELNVSDLSTLWSTLGLLACVALVYGLGQLASRLGSQATTVVLVLAPFAAAVVIAVGLLRNRLLVAAQLLPRLLLDPLDSGFDALGQDAVAVDPNPLGTTGLVMLQIAILTLGAIGGAIVARRRTGTQANPAIGVVGVVLFPSVLLVAGVAFPG